MKVIELLGSAVCEMMVHSSGIHINYLGHGDFEVIMDGEEYEVYCPISRYGDEIQWAGKFIVKKDGIRLPFTDEAFDRIDREFDKLDPKEIAQKDM